MAVLRSARSAVAFALLCVAAACAPAPTPEPPRVVAPPAAMTLVTPPPRDLSICQRDAKPTTGGDAEMIASFETFSQTWIQKMKAVAAARSAIDPRQIRNTYEMELRRTGSAEAPYVGVLSYCEIALSCASAEAASCKPTSSTVVKEMFRYQAGNWIY